PYDFATSPAAITRDLLELLTGDQRPVHSKYLQVEPACAFSIAGRHLASRRSACAKEGLDGTTRLLGSISRLAGKPQAGSGAYRRGYSYGLQPRLRARGWIFNPETCNVRPTSAR